MVAIVGGNELGLGTASGAVLGPQGQRGDATQGRDGEQVSVNAVTGNLIVQRQDELLKGTGPDINILRTYNSLGLYNDANAGDDNGDNWRLGYSRKIYGLTGTINTAGSTIKRLGEDGAEVVYTYDTNAHAYVTCKGDDAYDTLKYNDSNANGSGSWTWTDGGTQEVEIYAYDGTKGLLSQVKDTNGNTVSLQYVNGLITEIDDASGEKVVIDYDPTNVANIKSIRVLDASSGRITQRVHYDYDHNRLSTITVDLSPEDGSVADGKTYTTNYSYIDDTSRLISSIRQQDGSRLDFTYNGFNQIKTVSDVRGSDIRTTTFDYDNLNNQTLVTDPAGRLTIWKYDANGQVASIQQLSPKGADELVQYTYDALGNVKTVTDARGNTTTYDYDSNGNRTRETDALGNILVRQYGSRNELLSETHYSVPGSTAQSAQTTRYIYDDNLNLRGVVTPEGRVTYYDYDQFGRQILAIANIGVMPISAAPTVTAQQGTPNLGAMVDTATVSGSSLSFTDLVNWLSSLASNDLSHLQRTDTTYDFRGQISTITTYAKLDAVGNGITDGTQSTTQYVYDAAGNLLQKIDARGTATADDPNDYITHYTYDGLGRLSTATDALGQLTTYTYDDANRTTAVQLANGLITTTTYDQGGLVTSVVQSDASNAVVLGATTYTYDKLGNCIKEVDPTGAITYHVYDAAGRHVADVDPTGAVVEYVYDDGVFTSQAMVSHESLTYSSSNVVTLNLSLDLPVTTDSSSGFTAVATTYSDTGTAVETTSTTLAAGATSASLALDISFLPTQRSKVVVQLYQDGVLKAEVIHTDVSALATAGAANLDAVQTASPVMASALFQQGEHVIKTIRYANSTTIATNVDPLQLSLGGNNNIRPLASDDDRTSYTFYDKAGRKVGDLDGGTKALTEYVYDTTPVMTAATVAQETLTYSSSNVATITVQMPTTFGDLGSLQAVATGYFNGYQSGSSIVQSVVNSSATLTWNTDNAWADTVVVSVYKTLPSGERILLSTTTHALPTSGSPAQTQAMDMMFPSGSRYVETIQYAGLVSSVLQTLKPSDFTLGIPAFLRPTAPTGSSNRYTGQVLSADGLLLAEVDGDGYWTQYKYNAAGQVIEKIQYATTDQYKKSATDATEPNQHTYYLYNARGQLIGIVDPEKYLTEYQYDLAGNKTTEIRYANLLTNYTYSPALVRPVRSNLDRTTTYVYDQLNRLQSQSDTFRGSSVFYVRDIFGNVTAEANNFLLPEQQIFFRQYDVQGRLVKELSAEGFNALNVGSAPEEQIWIDYGTSYTYDADGRVTSKTGPLDANGQHATTWYYYDADGRVTETVNALGEVVSTVYDAFGDVIKTDRFNKRLGSTMGLVGGQRTAIAAAIAALAQSDTQTSEDQYSYNQRGQFTSKIIGVNDVDTDGSIKTGFESFDYNAFGELREHNTFTSISLYSSTNTADRFSYNNRGLQTSAIQDGDGLKLTTTTTYDGFGRAIKVIDPNGVAWSSTYDGLGRLKTRSNSTLGQTLESFEYDAFNNITTHTDAMGQPTTYTYQSTIDANGNPVVVVTVTTPGGVITSTTTNRLGQTVQVNDGMGITTYTYDADGHLKTITPPTGTDSPTGATSNTYDNAGHLITTTDANGIVTTYTYDIAGRVITRVVDPSGLAITTRTLYDAKGEAIWSQDANGVWTQTQYDVKGQVSTVTVDPAQIPAAINADGTFSLGANPGHNGVPLNIVTAYSYDNRGKVLTVTKGAGTAQQEVTRTIYDNVGRARFTIDAMNYVIQHEYDNNGNEIRTTRYNKPAPALSDYSEASLNTAITQSWASDSKNQVEIKVYDANNRVKYSIDAGNYLTWFMYDADGHLTEEYHYAKPLTAAVTPSTGYVNTTLNPGGDSTDRTIFHIYDKDGRERYTIDGESYLTQHDYDNAGHEINRIRYGRTFAQMGISFTPNSLSKASDIPALTFNASYDVQETSQYDAVGRLIKTVDGNNVTTYHKYDKAGNETDTIVAYLTSNAVTTHKKYDAAGRLTDEIADYGTGANNLNVTTRYQLDKAGNRIAIIDPRGVELAEKDTDWAITTRGGVRAENLTAQQKSDYLKAYTTTQEFDARGLITKRTDPLGHFTTTEYDAFGNAVKVTDPNGNAGYFYFNTLNQNTWQVDPEGYITQNHYTAFGTVDWTTRYYNALTSATMSTITTATLPSVSPDDPDPVISRDQTTKIEHDNRNLQTKITDAEGSFESTTYDAFGNKKTYTNKLGGMYQYDYDRKGNVTKETSPSVSVATVDSQGNQTTSVQSLIKEYKYDARGNLIFIREASGTSQQHDTTITYDKLNHEIRRDLPAISVFDVASRTFSVQTPYTTTTYDSRGNIVEIKDVLGNRTLQYYDALNRKVATLNAAGTLTEYTYDNVRNITRERTYSTQLNMSIQTASVKPGAVANDTYREMNYIYDANNRLTETKTQQEALYDPVLAAKGFNGYITQAVTIQNFYDANGNLVKTVNGRNYVTLYYYDKLGHRTLTVDPMGYVTRLEYDGYGNVIRQSQYDQKLSDTTIAALTEKSRPDAIYGEVAGVGQDRVTETDYDHMNRKKAERLLSVRYNSVSDTGVITSVEQAIQTSYQYDAAGNVKQINNADGQTNYDYNVLSEKISQQNPTATVYSGGTGNSVTTTTARATTQWQYDVLGNLTVETQLGLSSNDNHVTMASFDAQGNKIVEWDALHNRTDYAVDAAGNILRQERSATDVDYVAHSYRTYYNYDSLGRELNRQNITDENTSKQITGDITWSNYNAYGDVSARGVNGITQIEYRYDKLGHLFWTNADNGTPRVYVYDASGNAVVEVSQSDGSDLTGITSPNQVQSLDPVNVQFKFSLYDARNQLTDVFQAPMEFTDLTGALSADQSNTLDNSTNFSKGNMQPVSSNDPALVDPGWGNPTKSVSGTSSWVWTQLPEGVQPTVQTYLDPTTVTASGQGQTPISLSPTTTVTTTVNGVQLNTTQAANYTYQKGDTLVVVTVTTTRTLTTSGSTKYVLETKTTTTDTTTTGAPTTTTTQTDQVDYVGGTAQGGTTTTVETPIQTASTTTTENKKYYSLQNATTTNAVLGGDTTKASYIAYVQPQAINFYTYQKQVNFGSLGWMYWTYGGLQIPVISGFGNGPWRVLVEQTINGTTGAVYDNSNVTAPITIGELLGGNRVRIWKGGVQIMDVTTPGVTANSTTMTSTDLYTSGAVSVTANRDASVQGVDAIIGGQTISLTYYANMPGGAQWIATGVNSSNTSWQYNLFNSATKNNSTLIGEVQGSSLNSPLSRSYLFSTVTKNEYYSKVTNDAYTANSAETDVQQSIQQSNYLRTLLYNVVTGQPMKNVIWRSTTHDAFGEVISETDGRRNVTQYFYNEQGKVIRKQDPSVAYTGEDGISHDGYTPVTQYYVDASGNAIGTVDANNFTTMQVVRNGQMQAQYNPDLGVERHYYDIFGNLVAVSNAIELVTRYTYDKLNRQTRTDYPVGSAVSNYDIYEYDALGNRIAHTNGIGNREMYWYDAEGRIIKYRSAEGRETSYAYSFHPDIGTNGGYRKITTDPLFNTQTDDIDLFGKLQSHTDLGGHVYTYTYNSAGWLAKQTSTAQQDIEYTYYKNGYVKEILDSGIDSDAFFEYDTDGNRTLESYSQTPVSGGVQGLVPYQMAKANYDALNRVTSVEETGRYQVQYEYDKVSNRRRVKSTYYDLLTNDTLVQDFWYKYDRMNRFTITMGALVNGQIVRGNTAWLNGTPQGSTGYEISYNAIGQRRTQISTDDSGNAIKESYEYDNNGFLTKVWINPTYSATNSLNGVIRAQRVNNAVGDRVEYYEFNASGVATSRHRYTYDKDHILQDDFDIDNNRGTKYTLLKDGRTDKTVSYDNANSNAATVTFQYNYVNWDSYKEDTIVVTGIANGVTGWKNGTSTFTYDFNGHVKQLYDHAKDRTIVYTNNQNGQTLQRYEYVGTNTVYNVTPAVIRYFYYLQGNAIGDQGTDKVPSRVDYAQSLRGSALEGAGNKQYIENQRSETTTALWQQWRLKQITTAQLRSGLAANSGDIDEYQHKDIGERVIPVNSADFDQNFQPINENFPAPTADTYIVRTDDTLQSIAASVWGDSSLWYLIADANGLQSGQALTPDMRLTLPNVVTNIHNNASTHRVLQPGLTLGNTQPTLPDPPPPPPPKHGGGCGGIGMVLIIVVAVVATIFTAGAALAAIGGATFSASLAAGAAALTGGLSLGAGLAGVAAMTIGAAVGSIASQGVAMAMGMQDSFSWGQVGLAAVGGAIGGGLATSGWGQSISGAVSNATGIPGAGSAAVAGLSSLATQGFASALGVEKFSWQQVAASAVGSAVGEEVGLGLQNAGLEGSTFSYLARNTLSSMASRGIQSRITHQRPNWGMIAADSFGQSLGNAMTGQITDTDRQVGDKTTLNNSQDQLAKTESLKQSAERMANEAIQHTQNRVADELKNMVAPDVGEVTTELSDDMETVSNSEPSTHYPRSNIQRPSDEEIEKQRVIQYKDHPMSFTDGIEINTKAIKSGAIVIEQSENMVTLKASVPIYGPSSGQEAAAIMSVWDGQSATKDGVTYKLEVKPVIVDNPQDAQIDLDFENTPGSRAYAGTSQYDTTGANTRLGMIHFDYQAEGHGIPKLVGAHEFGHAFFGLADGYDENGFYMPNNYWVGAPVKVGMEGSIMADTNHGVVRPQDVIDLVKRYSNVVQQYVPAKTSKK